MNFANSNKKLLRTHVSYKYKGGQRGFTVVHMEKDVQV